MDAKQIILTATLLAFGLKGFSRQQDGIISGKDSTQFSFSVSRDSTKKARHAISIGSDGINIDENAHDSATVYVHWLMFDLGINAFNDKTDYGDVAARQYLDVPAGRKNADLFSLRPGKSVNVNIWPVLVNFMMMNGRHQKISFYTGAGLQLYNFRFTRAISYLNDTHPEVIMDSVDFSKNKLAFAFASVPLMINFKTRLSATDLWLTYGFGVIGGYCLDSWTKQISDERGKQKNHDAFNFRKFNLNLSAEIGIDDYIRFYATYQVTNMYKNALVQYPYAIGIRFLGI
ncbi:MAG TPA: hypothetical protein VFL76_09785 [Edaphocola sp.]|nr:hypothetical protein [Edaphocola sp.]